ncbi:hypothetical protein RRG08_019007 [Elysia crispata]|uniref:Uncharacterized protein n=1 Tax=Elysia crispata TaxID=231223 RepID=A0AAE1DSG2_9GAST|nr:hypothetical protein RRG08_019007 [Elysia crispata]
MHRVSLDKTEPRQSQCCSNNTGRREWKIPYSSVPRQKPTMPAQIRVLTMEISWRMTYCQRSRRHNGGGPRHTALDKQGRKCNTVQAGNSEYRFYHYSPEEPSSRVLGPVVIERAISTRVLIPCHFSPGRDTRGQQSIIEAIERQDICIRVQISQARASEASRAEISAALGGTTDLHWVEWTEGRPEAWSGVTLQTIAVLQHKGMALVED